VSSHRNIRSLFAVLVSLLIPVVAVGTDVELGFNLFRAIAPTYQSFSGPFAIPAGFFDPGSDPFEGTVDFAGVPLGGFAPCPGDISLTSTVVQRKAKAFLPGPGSSDVIPIELVQLSLVSVAPITVTYSGGTNPEPWVVTWTVSPSAVSSGTMTVHQVDNDGGLFTSTLYVYPLIRFTRVSDGMFRELDGGALGVPDVLVSQDVRWNYFDPSLACPSCVLNFIPGVFTAQGQFAAHSVSSGCPAPTGIDSKTWGSIKVLYR
jgi:hypothetical protein